MRDARVAEGGRGFEDGGGGLLRGDGERGADVDLGEVAACCSYASMFRRRCGSASPSACSAPTPPSPPSEWRRSVLLNDGEWRTAALYVLASVAGALAAAWGGQSLARATG